MCSKNNAGNVAADLPPKSSLSKSNKDRELVSSQAASVPQVETKFIAADRKIEATDDQTIEDLVKEAADKWCADNEGWSYTGTFKNDHSGKEDGEMITFFKVKTEPTTTKATEKEVRFADDTAPAFEGAESDNAFGLRANTVIIEKSDD